MLRIVLASLLLAALHARALTGAERRAPRPSAPCPARRCARPLHRYERRPAGLRAQSGEAGAPGEVVVEVPEAQERLLRALEEGSTRNENSLSPNANSFR